jgi:hypothetical protein
MIIFMISKSKNKIVKLKNAKRSLLVAGSSGTAYSVHVAQLPLMLNDSTQKYN